MSSEKANGWDEANRSYLRAALNIVGQAIDHHAASAESDSGAKRQDPATVDELDRVVSGLSTPPALERLMAAFALSRFERDVLLVCAGMELDETFAGRCAAAQGDSRYRYPTFGLALAALPEGHWSSVSPGGPLRYWRLIELRHGDTIVSRPLRIDERILHFLMGVRHLDQRLEGFIRLVLPTEKLVPTYRALSDRIIDLWSQEGKATSLPGIQLRGNDSSVLQAIALDSCTRLGFGLYHISAQDIPVEPRELESLARLWQRESILSSSALFLDCGRYESVEIARVHAVSRFLEAVRTPLIIGGDISRYVPHPQMVIFEVGRPTEAERRALWIEALGEAASSLDGNLDPLVLQYELNASSISSVVAEALGRRKSRGGGSSDTAENLRQSLSQACRVRARSRISHLAQRIDAIAIWDDIVLPQTRKRILREIAIHVRQRMKVYGEWGFARRQSRGLGISSLFAGPSGTGKTMAAEVLANELDLDLFRIDLSQVVSKYIGETEKNLRQVFDAAEQSGAMLLFDEADALFGKRSEVKDSHDRYANIEISYLLQRMEAYHGLAVLTTNMKNAVDDAFRRRIRFVVDFPFPDTALRAEIWRRIFPHDTPTEGLCVQKLATLNIAGGNINNMAMNAAFLAAEESEPVRMSHILQAARSEYAKLGRTLSQSEVRGWV